MKKRILILEDDNVNQELLRLYLKEHYDIDIVSSVAEAVEAIRTTSYDMVISDLYLGNDQQGGGLDFLRLMRSSERTKNTPVVAYSAFNDPNDNNEIQFSAFIPKPINKADFLEIIRKILAEN